ncbi:7526_t:CDS:2 [Cetraspora pellucida]|uniref:7526_t:CDS:1 n=1 Tax=Cetraspora pellucida TaxID=1433469 RepID=A0ACA9LR18_9GLOM|nr:7526_t:CDS:2 [Cetraspora pellucida]
MNSLQIVEESCSITDQHVNCKVIIITDDGESSYTLENFDKSMQLGEVRKRLFFDKNVLMGQNANFCHKDKNKIPITFENNYVLEMILIQQDKVFYAFHITKDRSKPSFPEIAKRLDLDKGLNKQEDGSIIAASAPAFRIKNLHMADIIIENKFDSVNRQTNKNFEELWIKSFEEVSSTLINNFESQEMFLNEYEIMRYVKCSIRLSYLNLEPTEEYVEAIKDALDKNLSKAQRRKELNKVGEKYGFFFAQEIKLGGKLQRIGRNQTEGITQSKLNDQDSDISEFDKFKVLGGDVVKFAKYNDTPEWLKSLKYYDNCEIIFYDDKLSLYELLSEKLKSKIRRVNSMKVFYSNVFTTNYFRSRLITKVPKPPTISTFKGYKIFASIFNTTDREPFNTFSIRIDYQDLDNPYFAIHCLEPVTENSPQISLLIPWMVIGYEENLPSKPFSINSTKNYIKHIWTKDHDDAEIVIPGLITQKHCWIGTCVLHCDENPGYVLGKSEIATSYHFCQKGNHMSICCNQHDLSTKSTNLATRRLKFKVNCAIIFNTDDPTISRPLIIEPEGQIWENRENMKHQKKNKDNIFTMRRWLLPRDERLIFASLFGSNTYKYRCYPFFLNISQDYFIIKSLENLVNQPINQINYVAMPRVEGNEKKEIINEENSPPIFSNHDHLDPTFTENIIKFLKLNNGLIVDSRDIYTAKNKAFNFVSKVKNIKGFDIKISLPKDRKELFLLKNHINVTSFQLLPQKLIQTMLKLTINNDNPFFDHAHFEVYYPKVELNFNKETIKPTKEIERAVDIALKSNKPYQELINVFNTFGFLIPQKFILGQKLYRTSFAISNLDEQQLKSKKNFFQNYLSNIEDLFALWENQYGFDEIYLMTTDGKPIEKNNIEKWIADNSKQDFKLLRIINRSKFLPLYEIFEEPVSHQIKTILGIDDLPKILMTGIVQVIKNDKYYKIKFSSNLESSNYHIFAKVISSNEQSFDKTIVKIQSKSKTGFLAIIENFDEIRCIDPTDLQIIWMLIGFPDEINFYSRHTRDLSLLRMESEDIILNNDCNQHVVISVPKQLPKNSLMALTFEYPLLSDNLTIRDDKIRLNIDYSLYNDDNYSEYTKSDSESENNESESDESESDKSEDEYLSDNSEYEIVYPLQYCIFNFDKDSIKVDISTSQCNNIYLKGMGLLIS